MVKDMKIGPVTILISECTEGIYLRWWFNGFHYFNFQNGYEIIMQSESLDTQVTRMFSRVSKVERPTKLDAEYSYQVTLSGITAANIGGFTGLLMAEKVEQYEGGKWYEIEITRGDHLIKNSDTDAYIFDFIITRKELPLRSTVFQNSIKFYIGDTLCDLDDDEIVPLNKQVNDIAEMQDRQSDFTAQFRIRKTRSMMALFELSGEVGANTMFPYQKQTCKLVQDSVEVITAGETILDKKDDQYYYVSILSGNRSFFNAIADKKLADIIAIANHDWTIANIKASQDSVALPDYLYPLCEPSDDGGIAIAPDVAGNTVNMYGGFIWPFFKVSKLWDEIFTSAGYSKSGDILTDDRFLSLYMPINNVNITKGSSDKYLYSVWWSGYHTTINDELLGFTGAILINGDETFRRGYYVLPYSGTYKITVMTSTLFGFAPTLSVYLDGVYDGDMILVNIGLIYRTWEYEITGTAGQPVAILTTAILYYYYSVAITEITGAILDYSSTVIVANHLPDFSQTDFLKMICNMFGLIPDVIPRDRKIKFWNFSDLYKNMAIARDWSAYLSEREDESEFKYGDYAQSNLLNYKESDDVIKDNGKGIMQVEDETLQSQKDVIDLPLSTCDEVIIATTIPTTISRIAFNKYDNKVGAYAQEKTIDARIVHVKRATGRTFVAWDTVGLDANSQSIADVRIASSLEVSFSNLVTNYASLSRLLTKTNLRRVKFNLPVYEVAGLQHNVPIYLSQYKAYFYVNKINNYVSGRLCTIDLIKL